MNTQSNRLDPSCEAAHAAAMDCFIGGSVVSDVGGGDMDDLMRRLGAVETDISGMKADMSAIKAVIPHLATKADVSDAKALIGDAKTSIIQWVVGTTIAAAGVAFAIAKFVH
ncbi:MAG: hypothetical protein WBE91_12200 [Steroidobacteraceae bacterium]